ncbi:MAG: cytochrome c class [Gemmatimonadetes bacterium]|nr:cytochrome c class [Gemmatimonadota bacterium]
MKWLRRSGLALGALVALLAVCLTAAYGFAGARARRSIAVPAEHAVVQAGVPDVATTPSGAALVERGRHLAVSIAKCVDCHGSNLGGSTFIDDPMLGNITAANLTTGTNGVIGGYDDAAIERAVRHGVRTDGTPIPIMPASDFAAMSDADLAAIIAYVRSVPAVNSSLPPTNIKLLGRVLYTVGQLPLYEAERMDHSAPHGAPIVPAPTREYGRYVTRIGGCVSCHGPGLSGGKIPGVPPDWPPAANLTRGGSPGKWTEAQFIATLRSGKRPDGSPLNPVMPWKLAGQMTDDEMHAVWLYLQSVPVKEFGGR